jgi:hypothetical protein
MFRLADEGRWDEIDKIPAVQGGPALLAKTLHIYVPDEVAAISSHTHLLHFLRTLGESSAATAGRGAVSLNRLLLEDLRSCGELVGKLVAAAREAASDDLREIHVFDVYRGDQVGHGRKLVAFSVVYQSADRTLTDEDAARLRNAIVDVLHEDFGAELRAG